MSEQRRRQIAGMLYAVALAGAIAIGYIGRVLIDTLPH